MIKRIDIENLGPLKKASATISNQLTVVIGKNDSGKTLLLKSIYASLRALETYRRGDERRSFKSVLDDKLFWTFQLGRLGDLVRKGEGASKLSFRTEVDDQEIKFSFSSSAEKGVGECTQVPSQREGSTVFIPAKEVLSLQKVIRKSREIDQEFGFDDTFLDLVNYLDKPTSQGGGKHVTDARKKLKEFLKGSVEFSDKRGWYFKKGNSQFDINITAEGVKKIAILDRLIGNKMINSGTVLIIDEPEAHLHPSAIIFLMDMLKKLCRQGVQVILSTHSYFVIKKLSLLAKIDDWPVQLLSIDELNGAVESFELGDGVPDIPIIQASVDLYEQELDIAFHE